MAALTELMKEIGITDEQIQDIVGKIKENPFAALGAVQELNLPPESVQRVVGLVMTNPQVIHEAMEEYGLTEEDVQKVKDLQNSAGQSSSDS